MSIILKQGWRLYRQNFGTLAAVVVAVWSPCELLSSYMDAFVFGEEGWRKSIRLTLFLDNFFGIIATGGVITIGYSSLSGGSLTFGTALGMGAAAWGRMFWTRCLIGLAVIGGFLLLVIPGIYLCVRLAFIEPVVICEKVYGTTAIRRSFELTKGQFWFIFRLGLVLITLLLLMIGLFVFLPAILIPALDNWLVDAATQLAADVLSAFCTLCLVTAYVSFLNEKKLSEPPEVLKSTQLGF